MTTAVNATLAGNRPFFTLTPLGALVGNLGAGAKNLFSGVTNPDAVIEALFANSEVGGRYDPSDLTTMFQDCAGTTPVTADGQPVGKILDKSGNDNHSVAPNDSARPLYKTDGTYHWLQFDGVNNSLSTAAINFTATDKMSVFSGRHKASNAAAALLYELSTDINANNGSMYYSCPENLTGEERTASKGTTIATDIDVGIPTGTLVISEFRDISAPSVYNRRNGVASTPTTSSQGTGNFGNYPLFIGSRNNSGVYFNGNIFSLIVLGRLATTQEITDTETWVNGKTGAY